MLNRILLAGVLLLCGCLGKDCEIDGNSTKVYEDTKRHIYFQSIDYGFASNSYYMVVDSTNKCIKMSSNGGAFYDGQVYLSPTYHAVSSRGRWITIIDDSTSRVTLDDVDTIVLSLNEGIYLRDTALVKVGLLTDYKSLNELKPGTYYLTNPGFFYSEKMPIEDWIRKGRSQ